MAGSFDSWRPRHAATPHILHCVLEEYVPHQPCCNSGYAVGQGKDLLAQSDVLRVACVGLTPNPGSCWVPEVAGKRDCRVGDVTRVCLCWWPWGWLTAPTTGWRDSSP